MALPQDIRPRANRKLKVLVNIIPGILDCVRIYSESHNCWTSEQARTMKRKDVLKLLESIEFHIYIF